ncbi:MAG: M48 family metalloprotease [Dehalococcoidia bacterium]|nr:M48 family metalloprotease [Dehalococcoidia bacterium]
MKNRDILTSSIAATIAGAITLIAQVLVFRMIFGGGQNQNPILMLLAILVAPIAATIIQMGISRTREYSADKTGAEITHDPMSLASALQKLERGVSMRPMEESGRNEAVASLYIVHPFAGGGMGKLFSTHPPIEERVKKLEEMATGRRG